MSKMCLILTGQMRTFDCKQILESYHRYLSWYEIDLYVFTWKNRGYSNNHGNPYLNGSQDDLLEEDTISNYYSQFPFIHVKKILVEDFSTFLESLTEPMKRLYYTPFRNHSNFTTSIPIEYKYQQAIDYLSTSIDVSMYPFMMMTRPDMAFVSDLPVTHLLENTIYYKHPCRRCMDHVWLGTPRTIIKQLKTIYTNYEKNQRSITSHDHMNRDNNELLWYQCDVNQIKVNVIEDLLVTLCHYRNL